MHPPRRNGASETPKIADRLADWLVTYCPLSTLTLLTLLVTSPLDMPRPWQIVAGGATADLVINVIRRLRRPKRVGHAAPVRPGVTA